MHGLWLGNLAFGVVFAALVAGCGLLTAGWMG